MFVLVKLRVALGGHTGMTHDYVDIVRQMDFHLSSGKRTFVNPHTTVEVIRDAGRVGAAHLALTRQGIQNFVLRVGAQALFEVN